MLGGSWEFDSVECNTVCSARTHTRNIFLQVLLDKIFNPQTTAADGVRLSSTIIAVSVGGEAQLSSGMSSGTYRTSLERQSSASASNPNLVMRQVSLNGPPPASGGDASSASAAQTPASTTDRPANKGLVVLPPPGDGHPPASGGGASSAPAPQTPASDTDRPADTALVADMGKVTPGGNVATTPSAPPSSTPDGVDTAQSLQWRADVA